MKSRKRDFFENLIIYTVLVLLLIGMYFLFFSSNFKLNIDISSYYNKINIWDNTRFADEKKDEKNITILSTDINNSKTKTNVSYLKYNEIKAQTPNNKLKKEDEIKIIEKKTANKEKKVIIKKKIEKITKKTKKIKTTKIPKKKDTSKKSNSTTKLFLENTKNKIIANINKLDRYKINNVYANIRVTILKNGKMEQLELLNGNKKYFKYIKSSILKSFPVKIDKKIQNQFPRYFRLKINN